jgi:hypothetical protein
MRTQGRATLLVCVVAALTAAGCGGGDNSNHFRSDYNKIVREFSSLPTDIGAAIRGASASSDAALARDFNRLADRVSQEAARMRKLDPPDGAKDEFDAFVAGLAKLGDDLTKIADAAKAHSTKKAKSGADALVRDSDRLSKQEDALKKAVD